MNTRAMRWNGRCWHLLLASALVIALAAESPAVDRNDDLSVGNWFTIRSARDGGVVIDPHGDAWGALQKTSGPVAVKGFPLKSDLTVDLQLKRFWVTSDATHFVLGRRDGPDETLAFDPSAVTLLRGHVIDDPSSHAFLAISSESTAGYVDYDGQRFLISATGDGDGNLGGRGLFVMPGSVGGGFIPPAPFCEMHVTGRNLRAREGPDDPQPNIRMRALEMAVETDYEYFELFDNLGEAEAYVLTLYGAVSDIYMRELDTHIVLTFARFWDTPDDLFNEPSPLSAFAGYWNANMGWVHRDVAQFLTGRRDLPYGGSAYVASLCGTLGYSVIGYLNGSFVSSDQPSSGNWDVLVTSHELGHSCGTLHTHDYNPPIDQCASGDVSRGTIMSYCSRVEGGVANVDVSFHNLIQETIEGFMAVSQCVVRDCNLNGVADPLDLIQGTSEDANDTGIPDECEDCNDNGVLDDGDIAGGTSLDLNGNNVPDECEPDCNFNSVPDDLDLALGTSSDLNGNNVPDECEPDCNADATPDFVEIDADMGLDIDRDTVLDSCQDCDDDGTPDGDELAGAHNLWVASSTLDSIGEYHAITGVHIQSSETGKINSAQDLIVGPGGRVLVASTDDDRVAEFDGRTGAFLGDFVSAGSGGLDGPSGLHFGPNGNLFVTSRNTDSVLEYDGDTGTFVGAFVTAGSGSLSEPHGLTFGPAGNLFVTSSANEILEYDGQAGTFLGVFVSAASGGLSAPRGLTFKGDGNLVVASSNSDTLLEYDGQTGAFVRQFDNSGTPGSTWGLDGPRGVRVGPGGRIYVSSDDNEIAIHVFDAESGAILRSFLVRSGNNASNPTGFDFVPGWDIDCNFNLTPDGCDIASGTSQDTDNNDVPDECEIDCNNNGSFDRLDIIPFGTSFDCNFNLNPDECDVADGTSLDCDGNGIPDECEDCNGNDIGDGCDIAAGTSQDCNANGIPDECIELESDCNGNDVPDTCDIDEGTSQDCDENLIPDECDVDCNANGVPDACDIASGTSLDCNDNGEPDECEPSEDCNDNGVQDICDIGSGTSADCNLNGIPDECDLASGSNSDCNGNGVPDFCDLTDGTSQNCNANGIPDECDIADGTSSDQNDNGVPDECEDCNSNGIPDDLDILDGSSEDCNDNQIPDECDVADGSSGDSNGDSIPDECQVFCETNEDCDDGIDCTIDYCDGSLVCAHLDLLCPCDGDANGDDVVDPLDVGFVLARFGCPVGSGDPSCDTADQNGDGVVDPLDVGFVLARFGDCP